MNFFAFSFILVFIFPLLVGIWVLLKSDNIRLRIPWFLLCITTSIFWGIGGYKFSTATLAENALFWRRIGNVAVIFTPIFYYHFVHIFLDLRKRYHRYIIFSIYISGFIFLALNFFFPKEVFTGGLRFVFNQFYYVDWYKYRSPIYLIFYISFYWILLPYSLILLVTRFRHSHGIPRLQIKYFILTSIIGWFGPVLVWLIEFRVYIYPYANFLVAAFPLIAAYAIVKYRLMDIKVAITRAGIFLIIYTAVLGIPFYVGYQTNSWILATIFAVILASLGPLIYRLLQRKAEDLLLAHQRHYQKLLLQAAAGMVREHNLDRLLKLIVYIIKKTVRVRFAAIFSHDKDNKAYVLKAARDHTAIHREIVFDEGSPFIAYLRKNSSPATKEEMPFYARDLLEKKLGTSFNLLIPSVIEDRILGILIMGEKTDKSAYSEDDINVFKILSHQAALAIENCMFFEEFKKIQSRIFEAEKLASIGGMADGVAHQIKNRLNHFSIATGELKFEIEDLMGKHPEFARDHDCKKSFDYMIKIADSLLTNVKRTDDIIKGILNYARTSEKDTFFDHFSLKEIINLSLELLRIKHQVTDVPLEEKLDSVDSIFGVKAQIMETVYNLLDNAYEATEERRFSLSGEEKQTYNPKITIEAKENLNYYMITVSDNGIGMREEDKLKIFAPFFTTKSSYKPMMPKSKSGTGIGIYVVRRLIEENHKGRIWFESEYLKGTTFYIELPKKKT